MINRHTLLRSIGAAVLTFCNHVHGAQLDATVEVDMEQLLSVGWGMRTKYRHSLDCYPIGKADKWDDLPEESIKSRVQVEGKQISVPIDSTQERLHMGSLKISLEQKSKRQQSNGFSEVVTDLTATVQNALEFSSYGNRDNTSCVINEVNWSVQQHTLRGLYKIKFRMPENTWAVKIKVSQAKGIAAIMGKRVEGDLHSATIEPQGFYVWARPGSWVAVPVVLNANVPSGEIGKVTLSITSAQASGDANLVSEELKNVGNALVKSEQEVIPTQERLIRVGAVILARQDIAPAMAKSMGYDQMRTHLDWLFRLANADEARLGSLERHAKAMAAVIGYELAKALLDDLFVFCDQIDLYFPLTDRHARVPGFMAAHFWLNREAKRIENIKYPEVISYLEEMVKWEKAGLTYAEVASDPKKFEMIRQGYIKIRRYSELALDVYGDIALSVERTSQKLGPAFASQDAIKAITSELRSLAAHKRSVNQDFQKEVWAYKIDNRVKINTSKVLEAVRELESRSQALSMDTLSQLKLVSFRPEDEGADATTMMTSMLAHQIGIFESPLQSRFAEAIRIAFLDSQRLESQKQRFQQCIQGGN